MQTQRARTENQIITSNQSLAAVQTLLRAGLGCITFLRDLLPNDNFTEGPSICVHTPDSMTRGYSDEADKILNYLEYGIFDALEKQYLRSFIFAIYLAEMFDTRTVASLTILQDTRNWDSNTYYEPRRRYAEHVPPGNPQNKDDPVSNALKKGRAPTLRDVKRSVKNLLKKLISAMSQMDMLPKRRFATFKLFYNDSTPAEYEPPHFETGDAKKDKWYFMTHDLDEIPDTWNVGRINAGYHAFCWDDAPPSCPPILTPMEEASLRARQAEEQHDDAGKRNIVWSAEDAVEITDLDADGDADPEYTGSNTSEYGRSNLGMPTMVPIGLRNDTGDIQPLGAGRNGDSEAIFGGILEPVPTSLHELNARPNLNLEIEQTQSMSGSQDDAQLMTPDLAKTSSTLAYTQGNSTASGLISPMQSGYSPPVADIEVQMLEGLSLEHRPERAPSIEMLDIETQLPRFVESTRLFSNPPRGGDASLETPQGTEVDVIDNGLECDCGVSIEDEQCFCEGGCGRWYHVCYHSITDVRMPSKFICFDCRLRADVSWELIKVDLYPKMISKFKELALFRKGGDSGLARHLFKRLELEGSGFIVEHATILDDSGLIGVHPRSAKEKRKSKVKQQKARKNVQKPHYNFNRLSRETAKYAEYFNPDYEVESRLLGVSTLVTVKANHPTYLNHATTPESQTQEETQHQKELKRPPTDLENSRPTKKVKISVTRGVDLAE
ncbi:HORMA domain-containing protein [Infundibulicybe gibba]|nr:HORMA domain-containing protein [Infundibulicybe gibba]